ncbi:MAG: VCBS repeat-containing protein, partial [Bacteroidota bacterium]
ADIFLGPIDNPVVFLSNAELDSYTPYSLSENIFCQGANFADINNDGDLDIFVCDDIGLSTPYENDGQGNFTYNLDLIAAYSNGPSDNSGNYASLWTDYDNDGDLDMYLSRCRQGATNPDDPRRINQLFQNDGSNNFTDVAEAAGLLPYGQSWSTDFADYDNDGDLDCIIINHDIPTMIFEQTSPGIFTDRSQQTGMNQINYTAGIQVVSEDFDNDGFQDILLTSGTGDVYAKNNGNFSFTYHEGPLPSGVEGEVHTAACGDLNNDGLLDLFVGRGTGYNTSNPERPDQ